MIKKVKMGKTLRSSEVWDENLAFLWFDKLEEAMPITLPTLHSSLVHFVASFDGEWMTETLTA